MKHSEQDHEREEQIHRQALTDSIVQAINRHSETYNKTMDAIRKTLEANAPLPRCSPIVIAYLLVTHHYKETSASFPNLCSGAILEAALNTIADLALLYEAVPDTTH